MALILVTKTRLEYSTCYIVLAHHLYEVRKHIYTQYRNHAENEIL